MARSTVSVVSAQQMSAVLVSSWPATSTDTTVESAVSLTASTNPRISDVMD